MRSTRASEFSPNNKKSSYLDQNSSHSSKHSLKLVSSCPSSPQANSPLKSDAKSRSPPHKVLIPVSCRSSAPIHIAGRHSRPSVDPIAPSQNYNLSTVHYSEQLLEQVSVLKSILGLSEDDLKWKVESLKGNSFLIAEQQLELAEERYDRLICEQSQFMRTATNEQRDRLEQTLNECIDRLKESTFPPERSLKHILDEAILTKLEGETQAWNHSSAILPFLTPDLSKQNAALLDTLHGIPSSTAFEMIQKCEKSLQMCALFASARASTFLKYKLEMAESLKCIEVWKSRRENAKELTFELLKRERLWTSQQTEENNHSLKLLRSLIPRDIHSLSVEALIEKAYTLGVLYTHDLGVYLKSNRFLHWIVLHEKDIAKDDFLSALSAPFFTNITSYDIHECRAVWAVMPEAFEADKEERKSAWRTQFREHLEMMVKQESGQVVRAGWDPTRNARGEVRLHPLSHRQVLNPVYTYTSESEIHTKLERFSTQKQRVIERKEAISRVELEIPQAKMEYLAIADDARCEDIQKRVPKEILVRLRDQAKAKFQALTKSREALILELSHLERNIATSTPSMEQFLIEIERIRQLDEKTRSSRIIGPFSQTLTLEPRARIAFRKMSVEEEVHERREELSHAIAERGKEVEGEVFQKSEDIRPSSSPKAVRIAPQVLQFFKNAHQRVHSSRNIAWLRSTEPAKKLQDNPLESVDTNVSRVDVVPRAKSKAVSRLFENCFVTDFVTVPESPTSFLMELQARHKLHRIE
uniref:Uncharacterized protein AlNc14C197G8591 n=1 Tax=Albugo laibachii Nc14 TaxID=890382 RepID=F0WQB0_9STRA|nr:conserved hypothetical protein [Albugo laibachii Nc14]|eukprot:CCA23518.1 conserved hypothetical protein [Albugo laibachii Nc14]